MLVDTAVWIDHLRRGDPILVGLLEQVTVAVHPFASASASGERILTRDRRLQFAARDLGLAHEGLTS